MNYIEDLIKYLSDNLLMLGPFVGMLICLVESLVPILPLALFIALNIKTFGVVVGFTISYVGCILGSILTYFLSKKLTNEFIESKLEIVKKINFTNFTMLASLPFTPAFLFNIISGITKMKFKKYLTMIFISKFCIVVFWGFVGYSFTVLLRDVKMLALLLVFLLAVYILCKNLEKKFKLN